MYLSAVFLASGQAFGALLGCYCKWCPVLSLHTVWGGEGVLFVCTLDVG